MNIIDNYKWRYATKRMTGEKVSSEHVEQILEAIRLAPTSMGLQPFNVFVISNPEMKKKMQPAAMMQPQIVESHYMLVFAHWNKDFEKRTQDYINLIAKTRNQTLESLDEFKNMILGYIGAVDPIPWAARQAYIALGFGLATAAMLNVDATPMEGFNPAEMDKVLELDKLDLQSVVMMAIGKRDTKNDYLVNLPKVRKSKENLFIFIE